MPECSDEQDKLYGGIGRTIALLTRVASHCFLLSVVIGGRLLALHL